MKKSCLFGLLLLMALPLFAEHVDPETARKVATTFLKNNGAKTTQVNDLSKEAGFPNLYIFTAEQGFVVMAADDCVKPILGFSLTGKFVVEDMPENVIWWLKGYSDQIQDAINTASVADASTKAEWEVLKSGQTSKAKSDVIVAPMLSTTWDQTYPYNFYCPSASGGSGGHVYTGCVATAMAQVMKYWDYPTIGNGSHSYTHSTYGEQTVNFGETTYDWVNMPNSLSSTSSQTQIDALATLMYHCGVSVDMEYGTGSSGTASYLVQDALIYYFRYAPSATYVSREAYTDAQWIAFLKRELDESRPLFYCGGNVNSGHAFVCDGYRSDDYFHFNWGWSGSDGSYGNSHGNNGYWAIGSLSPGVGGSGSGSGTYNLSNAVIAWVEPISELAAPTLSVTEMSGNIHLTWNSVSGASSYDVYKDNEIITTTTNCEYTDDNVSYGTEYLYYVRAVSSSDKSNPSNRISIMLKYHDRVSKNLSLNLSNVDNSIHLTWDAPETQSTSLYYGIGQIDYFYNVPDWGQKYSASKLSPYDGMSLNQVSLYARVAGTYTLYLYKDNTSNQLLEQEFEAQIGWNNVSFEAIPIDCSSDLWVIFHTTAEKAVVLGKYFGDDNADAHYLFYDVDNLLSYTLSDNDISWPIKLNITDGDFSYNVYRNDTEIGMGQTSSSFTDSPTENGNYEYYVKTCANSWVSEASETVSIDFSTMHTISETVSLNHDIVLSATNQYNISSTGSLSVSGTLSNDDAANLIIEDGGQLIHHSDNVQATVKKTIVGYGETEGGWYTIASPFGTFSPSNTPLTSDAFDLYAYDEDGQQEWVNYKAHTNSFNISPSAGYLYARHDGTSLNMTGTLNSGDFTETVNLSYANSNASIKGYNLLGNPTAHDITFTKTGNVADGYYYLANSDNWVYQTGNTVPSGRGFLVKANDTGQSVTLNPQSKENRDQEQYISLSIDEEKTYVKLTDGVSMPLLSFKGRQSNVFLSRNGASFIMLAKDEAETIDLCYRPTDGPHTLRITLEDAELDYLHLVDHLTGADIDLLQSPSYSFESSDSDYPTRFQLLFSEHADNSHNFNGVEFVDGKSQILDLTGRVVATDRNTQLTPGIYIVRTANGNEVKTEKIVVK